MLSLLGNLLTFVEVNETPHYPLSKIVLCSLAIPDMYMCWDRGTVSCYCLLDVWQFCCYPRGVALCGRTNNVFERLLALLSGLRFGEVEILKRNYVIFPLVIFFAIDPGIILFRGNNGRTHL